MLKLCHHCTGCHSRTSACYMHVCYCYSTFWVSDLAHGHGARSFEDGVRLVKLRGESMQAAADARPSAMVSVIGLDAAKVRPSAMVLPQGLVTHHFCWHLAQILAVVFAIGLDAATACP